MRSWCMPVHASASSGVGVQSWCMPRACQCTQRYGDVVLVCTRMPVRPVLKSAQMRSWCMLVHTSASSTVGMQSWCMPRACQCIQRSGDVVLVYAAHASTSSVQKKKKNLSKVRKFTGVRQSKMRSGYLDICRGISSTPRNIAATPWDRADPCTPAAACPMHGRAAVGVSEATRHARPELHTRYSRSNPARWAGTSPVAPFTPSPACSNQPGRHDQNFASPLHTDFLPHPITTSSRRTCPGRAGRIPQPTWFLNFHAPFTLVARHARSTRHAWPELRTCRALRPFSRVFEATW